MPVPTKARPEGFPDVDTGARPQLKELPKAEVLDGGPAPSTKARPALTASEVVALGQTLPTLRGELVLKALAVVPHSRVATMTICIPLPLEEATAQAAKGYRDNSWEAVRITTPPKYLERRRLSANSERYRMTATAQGGDTIGCPAADTHTKISLRFQERTPAPAATPSYKLETQVPTKKVTPRQGEAAALRAPSDESPPPAPRD